MILYYLAFNRALYGFYCACVYHCAVLVWCKRFSPCRYIRHCFPRADHVQTVNQYWTCCTAWLHNTACPGQHDWKLFSACANCESYFLFLSAWVSSLCIGLCYLICQIRCYDSRGKMIWCAIQVKPSNVSCLSNTDYCISRADTAILAACPGRVPGAVLTYTVSYQIFQFLGRFRHGLRFCAFSLFSVTFKACLHCANVV